MGSVEWLIVWTVFVSVGSFIAGKQDERGRHKLRREREGNDG